MMATARAGAAVALTHLGGKVTMALSTGRPRSMSRRPTDDSPHGRLPLLLARSAAYALMGAVYRLEAATQYHLSGMDGAARGPYDRPRTDRGEEDR